MNTSNLATSSPVSKKKMSFTREFTTSQTAQDFEPDKLEEQEQRNTPFQRYMKKVESDIEKKKSELRKLEQEEKEISMCNLIHQMAACVEIVTFDLVIRPEIVLMASAGPFLIAVRRNYILEYSTTEDGELLLIS